MTNDKDDSLKLAQMGHSSGRTSLAQETPSEDMTFETTFYDPLLNSLREFYDNEDSGNQGVEVISGEEYMRQLVADMNSRDTTKLG
ncbi:hypothetical protein ACAX43_26605 [Paraburkholderia sp. IW21]|uniref:hypothetical protein n=1 Tax=Paraburkholderia sp. IW21 TaxID=3242488 RepID=UPI00351FFA05